MRMGTSSESVSSSKRCHITEEMYGGSPREQFRGCWQRRPGFRLLTNFLYDVRSELTRTTHLAAIDKLGNNDPIPVFSHAVESVSNDSNFLRAHRCLGLSVLSLASPTCLQDSLLICSRAPGPVCLPVLFSRSRFLRSRSPPVPYDYSAQYIVFPWCGEAP